MRPAILSRLFPDQRRFYAAFAALATRVAEATRLLEQVLEDPERQVELTTRIQDVERVTEAEAHDIDLGMERMFIPPMDREDIHLLSTRLRRVVAYIAGTARRAVSLGAKQRREPAVALARLLVQATGDIQEAVSHMRDDALVLQRCREIKRAEEEGDLVWMSAVGDLFAGSPDPLDVLRWKTVYDQLEDALDECDDVANELETITVKHA